MRTFARAVFGALLGLALCCTGVVTPAVAAPVPPGALDTAGVDTFVEAYLDRHGLVGAQVAIVHQGEVIHIAGYGEAQGGMMTTKTPMAIASVSKQITSFAMLQLVGHRVIALDDPVMKYLPEFELDDDRGSEITIRHLLSHTSGLGSPIIMKPAEHLVEGVARLHDWRLKSDPGEQYRYSNVNYHVAARLIETVTDMPFAQYVANQVFQPLGMSDTRCVETAGANDPGLKHGHVTAYGTGIPWPERQQLLAGAGGVVTTSEDMGRWLAMLTNGGATPSGEQLLAPELLAEAMTVQPGTEATGLGWQLYNTEGHPLRVGHSGAIRSYTSHLDVVPSSGYGIAVLLNSYTPALEHGTDLSAKIGEITQGRTPELGIPVPRLLDAGLALLSGLVLILTVVGVRRSGQWVTRRASWKGWQFCMRLLPQLIGPVLAVSVLFVLPAWDNNSATVVDVFGFWPAAMILLCCVALSGIALITARGLQRLLSKPTG